MSVEEFIHNTLYSDEVFKKNVYDTTWLSGSQTTVYPVTIWNDNITIQWKNDSRRYAKWIDRMVKKSQGLFRSGCFWKSDGSCPSVIMFYKS